MASAYEFDITLKPLRFGLPAIPLLEKPRLLEASISYSSLHWVLLAQCTLPMLGLCDLSTSPPYFHHWSRRNKLQHAPFQSALPLFPRNGLRLLSGPSNPRVGLPSLNSKMTTARLASPSYRFGYSTFSKPTHHDAQNMAVRGHLETHCFNFGDCASRADAWNNIASLKSLSS